MKYVKTIVIILLFYITFSNLSEVIVHYLNGNSLFFFTKFLPIILLDLGLIWIYYRKANFYQTPKNNLLAVIVLTFILISTICWSIFKAKEAEIKSNTILNQAQIINKTEHRIDSLNNYIENLCAKDNLKKELK
jgi:hypothetical protein